MKLSLIACATALALSACAWAPAGADRASLTSGPIFRYAIEGPPNIGVVQAFNKDGQTFVQFLDIARANPAFSAPDGRPLGFAMNGQYAVLPGELDDLSVQTPFGRVRVYARRPAPSGQAAAPAAVPSAPAPVAASPSSSDIAALLAAARSELAQAETRIAELRAALAAIKGSTPGDRQARTRLNERIGALRSAADQTAASMVRVEFEFAGTDFEIASDVAKALVPAALTAQRVTVRGFTDSPVSDAANRRIALERALSARRYLVAQGVNPQKVRVFYQSAGGFVADNSTAEGRAKNRRVEIELKQPASERATAPAGQEKVS